MPTNDSTNTSSTEETSEQEQQDQQQQATGETSGNGSSQPVEINDDTRLPDTHPLVKSVATLRAEIASQKTELTEARAKSAQTTKLEEELGKRPTQEALDTLQTRYDRLESFLQALPGPVAKALDSRSFTRQLFETEDDIKDIVKAFQVANPTATNTALGSGAASPAGKAPDVNALLRAAAK